MTLVNELVALVAASLTPAAADIPLVPIGNIQTFRRADATVPMPTNFVIEGQIVASAGRRAVLSDGTASIRIFPLPAPDDETSEDWRVGDIVRVTCDQLPSPLTPNADVIHARSVTVLRHHQPQPPWRRMSRTSSPARLTSRPSPPRASLRTSSATRSTPSSSTSPSPP